MRALFERPACRLSGGLPSWRQDKESSIHREGPRDWINPDLGRVPLVQYANSWVAERPGLRPKTVQLYDGLVRLHMAPLFGALTVQDVTEQHVRRWRKNLPDTGVGAVTVAKAYRLLKAVLATAVDGGLIRRNPCRIKGAGQERSPERPVLTIRQVFVLAEAIQPRYRALILLAVFCSLRWGELAALRRCDIDPGSGSVRVAVAVVELIDGSLVIGPPKSAAGKRTVALPPFLQADMTAHLDKFTAAGDESLVFTGPKGAPLRRSNFTRTWRQAIEATGLTGFHFHDLRHTGNHIAGTTGANLRELMGRMGHSTTRAALIYQHRTDERDRLIAAAMGELVKDEQQDAVVIGHATGTRRQESIMVAGRSTDDHALTWGSGWSG